MKGQTAGGRQIRINQEGGPGSIPSKKSRTACGAFASPSASPSTPALNVPLGFHQGEIGQRLDGRIGQRITQNSVLDILFGKIGIDNTRLFVTRSIC